MQMSQKEKDQKNEKEKPSDLFRNVVSMLATAQKMQHSMQSLK